MIKISTNFINTWHQPYRELDLGIVTSKSDTNIRWNDKQTTVYCRK